MNYLISSAWHALKALAQAMLPGETFSYMNRSMFSVLEFDTIGVKNS
jgi:hypothetical protein